MPSKSSASVVYPKIEANNIVMTVDRAKELLGWSVIGEDEKVSDKHSEYVLTKSDFAVLGDAQVLCTNNLPTSKNSGNRLHDKKWVMTLAHEILFGNWVYNGESTIITKTGVIASGQHRLIAFVIADMIFTADKDNEDFKAYRKVKSKGLPFLLVTGVDDSDKVINTLDTARPRTLSDVLFRSSAFAKSSVKDRKAYSKIADAAVKFLWDRTGVKNPYDIGRTHSESVDFLNRHPFLIECVKHVAVEDTDKSLSGLRIPAGTMSALMYLFATHEDDTSVYFSAGVQSEEDLELKAKEAAEDFITILANDVDGNVDPKSVGKAVKQVISELNEEAEGGEVWADYRSLRILTIIKAFKVFTGKLKKASTTSVAIKTEEDEQGWLVPVAADAALLCGGIDVGGNVENAADDAEDEIENELEDPEDLTEDEVAEEAEEELVEA